MYQLSFNIFLAKFRMTLNEKKAVIMISMPNTMGIRKAKMRKQTHNIFSRVL